jgi:hypothetical protein
MGAFAGGRWLADQCGTCLSACVCDVRYIAHICGATLRLVLFKLCNLHTASLHKHSMATSSPLWYHDGCRTAGCCAGRTTICLIGELQG